MIRQTFRKLGLSLALDGSEDAELLIRDLPGIVVGDWRLADGRVNEQQVDDPVEVPESSNLGINLLMQSMCIKIVIRLKPDGN